MKILKIALALIFILFQFTFAQTDSLSNTNDSLNFNLIKDYKEKLAKIEKQKQEDSIQKAQLELELKSLKTTDNLKKDDLLQKLKDINESETKRKTAKKAQIDSLRNTATGYKVIGASDDTLFTIYSRIGATTAKERAKNISKRIVKLYDNDFLLIDSIVIITSENTYDIVYRDLIIMSITESDALWENTSTKEYAETALNSIRESIRSAKENNSFFKIAIRISLAILVLLIGWIIVVYIKKGYNSLIILIKKKKKTLLKDLSYRDYTFLTVDKELGLILLLMKFSRWVLYLILLYISLPILFSIFPFTRGWADSLFHLIWSPFKSLFLAIWHYLPNLFSIIVIYFLMKYFIRFVRYIFTEIEHEKLKLNGFHPDWAMPTFSIVKFLLYAFTIVLIFPYLPGSDSNIFKGVSVFIGVLFSLGSSSAIANMVAGLVITYMRPFKIGDRVKISEVSGDVIEKTLLVTRIKTTKNEIITIPNSAILSGNTINYSSDAITEGLIIHSTVTIGYDVAWKDMHQALIDGALKTDFIEKTPPPFVLQTSLDDFYVSYQINAYTKAPNKQAMIYSDLHQNIQDICNERGIEILSPHYRAARDGNEIARPKDYIPKDYKPKGFNINTDHDK